AATGFNLQHYAVRIDSPGDQRRTQCARDGLSVALDPRGRAALRMGRVTRRRQSATNIQLAWSPGRPRLAELSNQRAKVCRHLGPNGSLRAGTAEVGHETRELDAAGGQCAPSDGIRSRRLDPGFVELRGISNHRAGEEIRRLGQPSVVRTDTQPDTGIR